MTTNQHPTRPSRGLPVKSRYSLVVPVCMTILFASIQVITGSSATENDGPGWDLARFGLWLVIVALTVGAAAMFAVLMAAWLRQAAPRSDSPSPPRVWACSPPPTCTR